MEVTGKAPVQEKSLTPTENLKKLHDNLSKREGFNVPYEQFESDMQDENKLKTLHSNLSKQSDFTVPYDQFKVDMFDPEPEAIITERETSYIPEVVANGKELVGSIPSTRTDLSINTPNTPKISDSYKAEKPTVIPQGTGNQFQAINQTQLENEVGGAKIVQDQEPLKEETGIWSTWVGDAAQGFAGTTMDIVGNMGAMANLPMRSYLNYKAKGVGIGNEERQIFVDTFLQTNPATSANESLKISAKAEAEKLQAKSDRYNGEDFTDKWKQGDYGAVAGDIFLQGAKSLPYMIIAMGGGVGGLTAIGTTSAAGKYEELDNPELPEIYTERQKADYISQMNMSEFQKLTNSALTGTSEAVSELLGSVPMGKYIGRLVAKAGKPAAQEILQKGVSGWMNKMFDRYGLLLGPVMEGVEEVANSLVTDAVDYATGATTELNAGEMVSKAAKSFAYGVGGGAYGSIGAGAVIAYDKMTREKQPITTATIEGVQFTVNNPEDLGIEGKPIFAKDAEGNIIPISGKKKDLITDVVTQTQGELDQAQQAAADQQALINGIADPNAQILKDETFDEGARVVDFNNGQSKIIYNGKEVIANDENEKDEILNSITDYQKLPEAKTTPTVSTEPAVNTEPTDGLYSEPKTFNSQIPKKKVGNKEVTDYESAPTQTTLGALIEDFKDQSLVDELVNTKISDFESQINKIGKVKVIADIDQYKQNLKEAKEKTDAITKQLEYWKSVKSEAEVQAQNKARVDQEQKQAETEVLLDAIDQFNATPQSRENKQQASEIEAIAKQLGYQTERNAMNEIRLFDNSGTIKRSGGMLQDENVVSLESSPDNTSLDPEMLTNFIKSLPLTSEGFSNLDVKTQSIVKSLMFDIADKLEVRKSIVSLVPIDMVNDITGKNFTTEELLNDPSVFRDALTVDTDNLIIRRINTVSGGMGAFLRTISERMTLTGSSNKGNSTEITGNDNGFHGSNILDNKEGENSAKNTNNNSKDINKQQNTKVTSTDNLSNEGINTQISNEKSAENVSQTAGQNANQGEDTPQAEQGQGNEKGLEENVIPNLFTLRKISDEYLKSINITSEQFSNLSPEEQNNIKEQSKIWIKENYPEHYDIALANIKDTPSNISTGQPATDIKTADPVADEIAQLQQEKEQIEKEIAEIEKQISDIENNNIQGSYDFSASSNSGKWNSANTDLETAVSDHRKAFSIYKFLIGDMPSFKEIVDFINKRTDANIEYTERMRRADETMTAEEIQSAIDSYNSSANNKVEDKAQIEKDILNENGLQDETEYTPQELIARFPLSGVQKVIWNIIKNIVGDLGIKVKFSSSRLTEGFDGSNNPLTGEILIRPSSLKNGRFAEVLVHEIVHALTTKIINKVNSGNNSGLSKSQIDAVKGLTKLYEAIKNDNNLQDKYPVKDVFEFIAHLTNENFVSELQSKDKNFIQKVIDYISDILGISNANDLAKQYLEDIISDGVFLQQNGITVLSSDYNNVQGSKNIDELKQRLSDLKTRLSEINTELAALQNIISTDQSATVSKTADPVADEKKVDTSEQKVDTSAPLINEATKKAPVKKPNSIIGKAKEIEVAENDIQGLALQYFINGGLVHPDEVLRMFRNNKNERNYRNSYTDKDDGQTVAKIAHDIWQSLPENIQDGLGEMDVYNAVESVITSYNNPTLMSQALLKKYVLDPNQGYSEDWLNNQIKIEEEERQAELEIWNNDLAQLEINGQLPTENELIELFLPENLTNGKQEINQRGSIGSNRPVNPEGNDQIGQNVQGSEPGVQGEVESENSEVIPKKPLSEVLSDGKKEVQEKKQSENNANFENSNKDNGISEPVSQGQPGALHEENSGAKEFATECKTRIQQALRDAQKAEGTLSRERKQEIEQRTTEQFAKEKGLWIPLNDTFSLGESLPSGNENDVYLNPEQGVVYKVNNLTNNEGSIDTFLDAIKAHNELFPATKYELIGFTGIDGRSIMPVVKQSYIRNAEPATPQEIADYMQSAGFTKLSDRSFTNGQYTVSDLLPRNVLKDGDGDIFVIDDIIKPNKKQATPLPEEKLNIDPIKKLESENKSTLPKIPVGKIFSNDVQAIPRESRAEADKLIEANTFDQLPVETVSVSDIIPTQKNVTIPNIKEVANVDLKPQLLKFQGKYYVLDGHHRISNRILEGETAVEANVFDEDARIKEANKPILDKEGKIAKDESKPEKIEDFGEKILGAKKDRFKEMAKMAQDATVENLIANPLSKVFPEPDYKKLVESGELTPSQASAMKVFREQIPSKPKKSYKITRWAEQANMYIQLISDLASKNGFFAEAEGKTFEDFMNRFVEKYPGDLRTANEMISKKKFYDYAGFEYSAANYQFRSFVSSEGRTFGILSGSIIKGRFNTEQEAFKSLKNTIDQSKGKAKETKFSVYLDTKTGKHFIGYKAGSNVVRIKEGFEPGGEAMLYLSENQAELEQQLQQLRDIPDERKASNSPRIGTDYRNGKNVTPEMFTETFGFRGVQFGNYVENDRRIQDLNEAYDALMDLANVLNIPAKAISLNGELGMAFGARGSGKYAAHYEPGQIVINITKTRGAGSLAHEWFHAVDNYFERARGNKHDFITDSAGGKIYRHGKKETDSKLRIEVLQAFADLNKAIEGTTLYRRSKKLDATRSKPYWGTTIEINARAFEWYVKNRLQTQNAQNDYLANIQSEEHWEVIGQIFGGVQGSYPYPTTAEAKVISEAFDHVFNTIETKEEGDNTVMFRIIGEKGAASIDREEEVTTRLDNLAIAREMETSGKDAKTISLATGWERGADSKWRYEVPDIELKNSFNDIIDQVRNVEDKSLPLSQLIEDENLFKEYPKLKDTKILFYATGLKNSTAFANNTENVIGIAVTSPEYEAYRLGGSIQNRPIRAYDDSSLKSVLSHEIQHIIQSAEGFGRGGNPETVFNNIVEDRIRQLHKASGRDALSESEREEIEREVRREYKTSHGAYQRLVGEVESRNVQTRMNMTPEERRNALLQETEDVAREDQIILMEGMGVSNLETDISSTASADLSNRPNVVKALTKISDELGEPVHIINSSEIPAQVGELKKQITSGNRVPAFFYNGQIYLLSDQVTSVSDAIKSYLHELIVHKGLREVFAGAEPTSIIGKQYAKFNDLMVDVFGSMSRSQKIETAAKYIPGLYNENGKIMYTPTAAEKALIGEEFLAHVSENQEIYDEPTLTKWQQFINRLAQIIRKAFRLTSNQFSQSDLLDIVRESRVRLKGKAEGKTEDETRFRLTEENLSLGDKPNDMKKNTVVINPLNKDLPENYRFGKITGTYMKPVFEPIVNKVETLENNEILRDVLGRPIPYSHISVYGSNYGQPKTGGYFNHGLRIDGLLDRSWAYNSKDVAYIVKEMEAAGYTAVVSEDGYSAPTIKLTHIKTKQYLDKITQERDIKFADVPIVYMRFGKSPKGGFSMNYRDNEKEKGVSVFEAKIAKDGDYRILNATHVMEASWSVITSRPIYVLTGEEVGKGVDGEPVIKIKKEMSLEKYLETLPEPNNLKPNTILINGTPRSTLNSNGKPIANSEEGIRNFWKWFGDSKVVDSEGRPLVVYHSTNKEFNEFKGNNIYFSPNRDELAHYGKNEHEVYLKIENLKSLQQIPYEYNKKGWLTDETLDINEKISKEFRDELENHKSDGLYFKSYSENNGEFEQYVVFYPSQIKSATGNNGSFDPESNDIRFQIVKDEALNQLKEDLDKITTLGRYASELKELEDSKVGKKVAERKVIMRQISGFKQGYRAGVAEKRLTLQVIHRNITKYANENMNYDDATRYEITQLLTALNNANTPATISNAFDKIDELASKGLKRKLLSNIARILKNANPKLQSGKPVGKLAPETYKALTKIKEIASMTSEQYDNYLELIADNDIESIALASMFGNIKEKSISDLFEAFKALTEITAEGRLWYNQKIEELKLKHKSLISRAVSDITGGKGIQSTQDIRSQKGNVDKSSYLKEFLGKNQSFEWLLDLISNNKSERTGWGFMQDHFGDLASKSENAESKGLRETIEQVNKKAFEIFGKEKSALAKVFGENSRMVEKTGVTFNTNDGRVEISLSQNEAYKRWMEMNDPTLKPTFDKMGWDEQSLAELEKFLDPKVLAWAKWQINEFYPEYYKKVNEVYKSMYFVDLPFNPSYSGYLKREKTSVGDKEDTMLRPDTLIGSVANSSLKSRIRNVRDIMLQDGDQTLAKHVAEMEHFMAWAETIREIRAVLSNDEVQDAIKKEHGNNIRTVLNERINSLVRGGVDRGEVNYLVDFIRKNYVTSALGVNLSLTPKQMTAIFSYLNEISIMDYIKGAAEFFANPKQAIEILSQSEFVQRRYKKGWTHEIEAAMKKNNPNTLAGTKSTINLIRDALMLPVMLGDKFAVYAGYPVYAKFYKQYISVNPNASGQEAHEFALNKFERVTKRTQQSSDVSDTSRFQETSVGKVFMMFKNAQQQYFRYEMAAINNLIRGRGNTVENAKIIFVTHVVLPVVFQMVANWFTDDDDETELKRLGRAALLGPIDGLMIAGDIVGFGLEKMMGERWSYSASPMLDVTQDLGNSITQMVKYINEPYPENQAEELQKALDFAIKFTSSTMTGIPYEPVKKLYNQATGEDERTRKEEDVREIISKADKYLKFVRESAKRQDNELHDKLMSDKTVLNAVSMLVISDQESGRKSYDTRITNLKKAIKYYKNIKTPEAKKKVDEYELYLENTYNEILEKYSDVEFPSSYKLNK